MISLYTTAFNLGNFGFSLEDALSNWLYYVDEVVISTLTSQVEEIKNEVKETGFDDSVKIVAPDLNINEDLYWVGKLKDASLKKCTHDVVIQADFDERISGSKESLHELAKEINIHDFSCSIMLPTIDLYEDLNHYMTIGSKWYLHTRRGTNRGAVNFGIKEDGSIDPKKSDTCELIDTEGNLIPCIGRIEFNEKDPKIIHLGYLNLNTRNEINKNFWSQMWRLRTGSEPSGCKTKVFTSEDPRKKPHQLSQPLWPTL